MELVLYKRCFQVYDARTTQMDLIIKGMAKEQSASGWAKLKKIMLSSLWEIIMGRLDHRKSKAQEVQDVRILNYIY